MNSKIVLNVLVASLLAGCGSNSNDSVDNNVNIDTKSDLSNTNSIEPQSLKQLRKLIESETPNIPLAEMLSLNLINKDPEGARLYRRTLATKADSFNSKLAIDSWLDLKKKMLIGYSVILNDEAFLEQTLNFNSSQMMNQPLSNKLYSQISGAIRSAALQRVLLAYDQQIATDGKSLAMDAIQRIQKHQPAIIKEIDQVRGTVIPANKQIEKIVFYLKKADHLFAHYQIQESDQEKIIVYTAIAGVLAQHLQNHPTVKSILGTVSEVKNVADKVTRIVTLAGALEKHSKEMYETTIDLTKSAQAVLEKTSGMMTGLDSKVLYISEDARKKARLIVNEAVNGRLPQEPTEAEAAELQKIGFFQKKREIDHDIKSFITHADKAARSLDNILNVAEGITNVLGVRLSDDVKNAINVARNVSNGVQVVSSVVNAFQSGGFVGALGAFSGGGPAMMAISAFGGMGGDAAIQGELRMIQESLTEIKEMQKEIIANQKVMMTMIKDLALMLEDYHWEQMRALTDIRADVLALNSSIRAVEEKEFYGCQSMASFPFGSRSPNNSIMTIRESNIDNIKQVIKDYIGNSQNLKTFLKNISSENFSDCQKELGNAFVNWDSSKFDRTTWYGTEDSEGLDIRSGVKISHKYFQPALEVLSIAAFQKDKQTINENALYLPALTVGSLKSFKDFHLYKKGNSPTSKLRKLTATDKLEKYVSALLILHPFLTLDYPVWERSIEDILEAARSYETHERTKQLLNNALEKVKTSIAQEAILVGEPLLPFLSRNWSDIAKENTTCKDDEERYCFVRINNLMAQNLLMYVLKERVGFERNSFAAEGTYERLVKDPAKLAELLGVDASRLKEDGGRLLLSLSSDGQLAVQLPSQKEFTEGRIIYTQTMIRMIRLADRLTEELLKTSPTIYTKDARDSLLMSFYL